MVSLLDIIGLPAFYSPVTAGTGLFFALTPDRVLAAVEEAGVETTGRCYLLGSLENRVYEVEREDGIRVIAKFYRPGRWETETILDEHRLLRELTEEEIPVIAPTPFPDGRTLHEMEEGIRFALFPKAKGRSPDEMTLDDFRQIGRLLGRIHNVSSAARLAHRPELSPRTYGADCLRRILELSPLTSMPAGTRARYEDAVQRLVAVGEELFRGARSFVVHADCHRGNLLRGPDGFFFLDFDDMASAPPVQDLWLILPARPADCPAERDALIEGYETFRSFEWGTLRLVEVLRGLRYVRYAAWIAERWKDPAFPRAFPQFGTPAYWESQIADLYDQLGLLEGDRTPYSIVH
jgi:Ser/Thr protein kinase RdoA (MazF antagonist)